MKLIANLACVADVLKPRLVTSAKQCRDLCSGAPNGLDELPEMCFEFPFILRQIDNGSFNRPIMVHRWGGHRWGPETKISALFRRQTEPEFSFVCGAGYIKIGTMGKGRGGEGGLGDELLTLPVSIGYFGVSLPIISDYIS